MLRVESSSLFHLRYSTSTSVLSSFCDSKSPAPARPAGEGEGVVMLLSFLEVVPGFAGGWSRVSGLYPNPYPTLSRYPLLLGCH
jgi:hypothetical protein